MHHKSWTCLGYGKNASHQSLFFSIELEELETCSIHDTLIFELPLVLLEIPWNTSHLINSKWKLAFAMDTSNFFFSSLWRTCFPDVSGSHPKTRSASHSSCPGEDPKYPCGHLQMMEIATGRHEELWILPGIHVSCPSSLPFFVIISYRKQTLCCPCLHLMTQLLGSIQQLAWATGQLHYLLDHWTSVKLTKKLVGES